NAASLDVDAGDLHFQLRLTMADLLVIALAALVLDGVDLGPADGADDVGGDARPADQRRADLGLAFAGDEQHAVEGQVLGVAGLAVDANHIAAGHLVLPAAFFNDRVHLLLISVPI